MDNLEHMAILNYVLHCVQLKCHLNQTFLYVVKIMYVRYKSEYLGLKRSKKVFQELLFYNVLVEKPRVKFVKNIDLLHELPFFDELSIVKISEAFKRYARSYKLEIIGSKDP